MNPIEISSQSRAWTESRWAWMTEQEALIDLAEWADAAGRKAPTSYRCALSGALWTLLEAAGTPKDSAGLEPRIRPLVRAADRILRVLPPRSLSTPGIVADFAVLLPTRSGAPSGHSLRLHAERSTDGALFVSIGLRADFSVHPLERLAGEPPCDTRREPTHRSDAFPARRPAPAARRRPALLGSLFSPSLTVFSRKRAVPVA